MANDILTIDMVTAETQAIFHNMIAFSGQAYRGYDDRFGNNGAQIGDSIRIRNPARHKVRTTKALNVQDTDEDYVTLTLDQQAGVDTYFSTKELTLDINSFSEQILRPKISQLVSHVDHRGLQTAFQNMFWNVGTPGTSPATAAVLLDAGEKIDYWAAPRDGNRAVCVNPAANAKLVNGLKGLFHPGDTIAENYRQGVLNASQLGFRELAMTQNVATLTTGTGCDSAAPLVDTTTLAEGFTTLNIDGLDGATDTFKAGEKFTIANVYSINPETRESTGQLQQFVITADATAAGSQVELTISPAVYTNLASDTSKQTVYTTEASLAALDGNAITFAATTASTTYPQNIAMHRDAVCLGTADLEVPEGVHFAGRSEMDGISIRIVRQYDINNDNIPARIDCLHGWLVKRPEWGCVIWG